MVLAISGLFNNTTKQTEVKSLSSTEYKTSRVSWYGPGFHGRKTASGEIYDQNALTCASPNLPFSTTIEIINVENDKSVIVRVNDRGPFAVNSKGQALRPLKPHPTRAFDLSKKAFSLISNTDKGVIKVRYRIIF